MSVAIKKIQGVESVSASLNQGLVVIRLKPGNSVRLGQVKEVVENNGFTPKQARVIALGEVISSSGKVQFKLLGTNETFDLLVGTKGEKVGEEIKKQAGNAILIEGVVPATRKAETSPVIEPKAIKETGKRED